MVEKRSDLQCALRKLREQIDQLLLIEDTDRFAQLSYLINNELLELIESNVSDSSAKQELHALKKRFQGAQLDFQHEQGRRRFESGAKQFQRLYDGLRLEFDARQYAEAHRLLRQLEEQLENSRLGQIRHFRDLGLKLREKMRLCEQEHGLSGFEVEQDCAALESQLQQQEQL